MQIRSAKPADATAIVALIQRALEQVNALDEPLDVVERLARNLRQRDIARRIARWHVLVAEDTAADHATLVGTAALDAHRVRMLFVRPDRQQAGIGGALLARLREMARDHGVQTLEVASAAGAEGFYRRHGFVPYRSVTDRGQRLVLMRAPVAATGQSKNSATARVQPAEASLILHGKQAT